MARAFDPGGVVDTDILVDALRGVAEARDYLAMVQRQATISVITQMELIEGCRHAAELRHVERFVRRFLVRDLSDTIGTMSVSLMRRFRLSHGVLLPDALIVATAVTSDVTLYTKNVRHFRMIPGLRVMRPY